MYALRGQQGIGSIRDIGGLLGSVGVSGVDLGWQGV